MAAYKTTTAQNQNLRLIFMFHSVLPLPLRQITKITLQRLSHRGKTVFRTIVEVLRTFLSFREVLQTVPYRTMILPISDTHPLFYVF